MKKLTKILVFLLILPLLFVVSCSTTSDGGTNDSSTLQDITGVYLNSETFEYDGQVHSLVVNGPLPGGITIDYTNNDKVDAGVYEVVATLSGEGYNTLSLTATLTITQATLPVQFLDQTFIYNGTEKEITIVGNLPDGVTVSYENNKLTDAGEITATAHFTSTNTNYNVPETMTAKLTVAKSDYHLSLGGLTCVYNGAEHELTLSPERVPEWITVRYENNKHTNVGEYLAIAYLTSTNPNYSVPEKITGKLTIEKANFNFSFYDRTYKYDETEKELILTNDILPEGITVKYENNKLTEVGETLATAYITSTNPNYNVPDKLTAKLTIEKADVLYFDRGYYIPDQEYVFDGKEKEFEFNTSNVPSCLSVTIENNKLTLPDSKVVKVTFKLLDTKNYNPIKQEVFEPKLTVKSNVKYIVNKDNTISINNKYDIFSSSDDLVIPSYINGLQVVEIADNGLALYRGNIILPNTIKRIGKNAFWNCGLKQIEIPSSVTTIDDGAFNDSDLEVVTLPDGLKSIGNEAFASTKLIDVTIPLSVEYVGNHAFTTVCKVYTDNKFITKWDPNWALLPEHYTVDDLIINTDDTNAYIDQYSGLVYRFISPSYGDTYYEIIDYKGTESHINIPANFYNLRPIKEICPGAFRNNLRVRTINMKDSNIYKIGKQAFYGCSSLYSINLPNDFLMLDDYAFKNCNNLTDITVYGKNTVIKYGVFENCTSLTSATLPDHTWGLYSDIFKNCTELQYVKLPTTVEGGFIGDSIFEGCSKLTEVSLPINSKDIGLNMFQDCTNLTSLVIPETVTRIGWYAFANCSNLNNIVIPNNVTEIMVYAFRDCSSLTDIVIPNSVKEIGWGAFENCTSLTNVTLSNQVTKIERDTFMGCTSLSEIVIPEGVTDIGYNAFNQCKSLTSITLPNSITSLESHIFSGCSSLISITIPTSVTSIGNYAFNGCSSLTSITIPTSVTSIGDGAFRGCSSLTSITIPDSVTSMGSGVFSDCSNLTSVTLPNSLITIGNSVFSDCSSLKSIVIPDSVTSIGYGAFSGCSSLTSITIPNSVKSIDQLAFSGCSSLTSITIPNSVTSIGYSAFENCSSLTEIIIPISVVKIGSCAFNSCTNLKTIYCEATEKPAEWDYFWVGYIINPEVIWGYKPKQQ